uniref:Uncharacterized protein n=1 Tax=Anguilla anguilla TaxID=7936 RepID=A0A0E9U0M7_ANGAN
MINHWRLNKMYFSYFCVVVFSECECSSHKNA